MLGWDKQYDSLVCLWTTAVPMKFLQKKERETNHTQAQMTGAENRSSRRAIQNPQEPNPSIHPLAPAPQIFHPKLFPIGRF